MNDSESDTTITPASETTIQIPGYELQRYLGKGAMASVYLAIQKSLERKVALKLMATSLVSDPTFCERFLKEGKIIALLNHRHIVTIYDIGVFQSCYYMAMEYLQGGTLKERLQEGLATKRAVEILRQIATALGYAHQHGFVHRDVKPGNILFREDDTAVLSDFGIAKAFDAGTQITAAGWTMGTPSYMSPEQAMGRPVDARSDLYGLGIVFYEMLTGAKPYESTDLFAIALMHVNSPVPRLPDKLACYQGIIDKLLAKDPSDRFSSAEELIKALDDLDTTAAASLASPDEEVTRVSPLPPRPVPKYSLGLLALILLVLMGSITYHFWPKSKSELSQEGPPDTLRAPSSDPKTRVQADAFLENARFNSEVGYLIYPYGTNAAQGYCQALSLDPRNAEASKGLSEVAAAYAKIPIEEVNHDELADSLKLIEDCLAHAPGHLGLLALRDRIKQQLDQGATH